MLFQWNAFLTIRWYSIYFVSEIENSESSVTWLVLVVNFKVTTFWQSQWKNLHFSSVYSLTLGIMPLEFQSRDLYFQCSYLCVFLKFFAALFLAGPEIIWAIFIAFHLAVYLPEMDFLVFQINSALSFSLFLEPDLHSLQFWVLTWKFLELQSTERKPDFRSLRSEWREWRKK